MTEGELFDQAETRASPPPALTDAELTEIEYGPAPEYGPRVLVFRMPVLNLRGNP